MDNTYVVKTTLIVEKKPFVLVLPYLALISSQTTTRLKKSLKNILNCCKMQTVLRNRLDCNFHFEDRNLLVLFLSFRVHSATTLIMVNVLDT